MAGIRRRIALTATAVLVVMMASASDSVYPLSDPTDAKQEPTMYGCWVRDGEYIFIGKSWEAGFAEKAKTPESKESREHYLGQMHFQRVQVDEKTGVVGLGPFQYASDNDATFWVTDVGGLKYANLVQDTGRIYDKEWGQKDEDRTELIRIEVTKNKLRIWGMSTALAAKAVDDGKLRGKVGRDGEGKTASSVTITEKREGLRDFIKGGGELFEKEPKEYTRGKVVTEK